MCESFHAVIIKDLYEFRGLYKNFTCYLVEERNVCVRAAPMLSYSMVGSTFTVQDQ